MPIEVKEYIEGIFENNSEATVVVYAPEDTISTCADSGSWSISTGIGGYLEEPIYYKIGNVTFVLE